MSECVHGTKIIFYHLKIIAIKNPIVYLFMSFVDYSMSNQAKPINELDNHPGLKY